MKRRSKVKEVALLTIPCVLFLALAFYWVRVEAVSAPGGSQMFVSKVEIVPASGQARSMGTTHWVEVTIDHPWPQPKWWPPSQGNFPSNDYVDALTASNKPPKFNLFRGERPDQFLHLASGGAVTWEKAGRIQRLKSRLNKYDMMGSGRWRDGHLIFTHSLNLQDLRTTTQPLKFQGLYFVMGQPPLRVSQLIRGPKQKLRWDDSRDPGGKILSIVAEPFFNRQPTNVAWEDECYLTLNVSHPAPPAGKWAGIGDYDWKIVDGKGRVWKADQRQITTGWWGNEPKSTPTLRHLQSFVSIKHSLSIPEPITLVGKVSIDEKWPIPVHIKLPSRYGNLPTGSGHDNVNP